MQQSKNIFGQVKLILWLYTTNTRCRVTVTINWLSQIRTNLPLFTLRNHLPFTLLSTFMSPEHIPYRHFILTFNYPQNHENIPVHLCCCSDLKWLPIINLFITNTFRNAVVREETLRRLGWENFLIFYWNNLCHDFTLSFHGWDEETNPYVFKIIT